MEKFIRAYRAEDFEDFLDREWMKRVWTFQEIILACNPVILCGNKRLLWDDLLRGIEFLVLAEREFRESMAPISSAMFTRRHALVVSSKVLASNTRESVTSTPTMRYLAHHVHCLDANQPKNSLEWSTN
jgi:hypothetical protein